MKYYVEKIFNDIKGSSLHEINSMNVSNNWEQNIQNRILSLNDQISEDIQFRLSQEFFGMGPIESLIKDPLVSEIIINDRDSIWFEKNGELFFHSDHFLHEQTFQNFVQKISQLSSCTPTVESPAVYGDWNQFRVTIIHHHITQGSYLISLRKHPENPWTLDQLYERNWCQKEEYQLIHQLVKKRHNCLIIGGTGSGKTSILNSLIQLIPENQRIICIEDTSELKLNSHSGIKLLTKNNSFQASHQISALDLLKYSLRLRPDRIMMGEIRSDEAKDFVLAISSGHQGSMATLHAEGPHQALIRFEMLIQLGAPQWDIMAIRKMIWLSLNYIICCKRTENGQRILEGVYKITSLEETGFLMEKLRSIP